MGAVRVVLLRAPDGTMAALLGSKPVSGTYAQPGATVVVELGNTSISGIMSNPGTLRSSTRSKTGAKTPDISLP